MSARNTYTIAVITAMILFTAVVALIAWPGAATAVPVIAVEKSATCGCCREWIQHLEDAGLQVDSHDNEAMGDVKREAGVPQALYSCHTARVGDYVIEGHVPADLIARLTKERPAIAGLAVAGMPQGAPGMKQGAGEEPYEVRAFTSDGRWSVYAAR